MLQAILCIISGILLLFFFLPSIIGLRVERQLHPASLNLQLDWVFFIGLAGFRLHFQPPELYLYPLFLSWRPGLLRLQLRGLKTAKSKASTPPEVTDHAPAKSAVKKQPAEISLPKRLSQAAHLFVDPGLSFLKHLGPIIKPYRLRLSGHFGFEDPAKTGRIYGYINSFKTFDNKNFYLNMTPDFESPGVHGKMDMKLRLYLGYLIVLALVFTGRVGFRWLAMRFSFRKFKSA